MSFVWSIVIELHPFNDTYYNIFLLIFHNNNSKEKRLFNNLLRKVLLNRDRLTRTWLKSCFIQICYFWEIKFSQKCFLWNQKEKKYPNFRLFINIFSKHVSKNFIKISLRWKLFYRIKSILRFLLVLIPIKN